MRILSRMIGFLLFVFGSFVTKAQEVHFVYLQSDNSQPFYVRLNSKVYSSTTSGFVILSKLTDGSYPVVIGFPKNEFPEEQFDISISGRNDGLLLKRTGDGLSLQNMETGAVITGERTDQQEGILTGQVAEDAPPVPVQKDEFSSMLADVVKDSTIKEPVDNPVVAGNLAGATEIPADTLQRLKSRTATLIPVPDGDGKGVITNTGITDTGSNTNRDVTRKTEKGKADTIDQLLSRNSSEGKELVYMDRNTNDTVRILIPGDHGKDNTTPPKTPDQSLTKTPDPAGTDQGTRETIPELNTARPVAAVPPANTASEKNKTVVFEPDTDDAVQKPQQDDSTIVVVTPEEEEKSNNSGLNSNCSAIATTQDFLRLRKKMAKEFETDKMINTALKSFKTRCYTTDQIRDLAYLFLDDDGKYRFFDAVYQYAADSERFSSLASTMKDPYYIGRFNAMIR